MLRWDLLVHCIARGPTCAIMRMARYLPDRYQPNFRSCLVATVKRKIHLRRARHGELIPGLRGGKGRVVVQALDELQGSGWTSPFGCNPAE